MVDEIAIQSKLCNANNLLIKARQDYKLKHYKKILKNCKEILVLLKEFLSKEDQLMYLNKEIVEILFTTWVWMGRAYHKLGDAKSSQECFKKEKHLLIKTYENM